MNSKSFFITLFITYLYIAIFNFLAHGFILSSFIGSAVTAINADFAQFRVQYLMLTWFVIALGTVYFTIRDIPKDHKIKMAVITGALIGLIADGTWAFTNVALVPGVEAFPFVVAELTWHILHGAFGGILALKTYEWLSKRFGK